MCEAASTVLLPSATKARSQSSSARRCTTSSPAVGSSRMSSSAPCDSAIAIESSFFCPPDRCFTFFSGFTLNSSRSL